MPTMHGPLLEVLPADDCRRLLASAPIGRLAFTVGALPTIQPVHFTVRRDEVLIPTRRGGTVETASRGAVVAFEVDEYDAATRLGWSVTVVGPSRVLGDAAEVSSLHQAGMTPWIPAPDACVVTVGIARISGRRVLGAPTFPGHITAPSAVDGGLAES